MIWLLLSFFLYAFNNVIWKWMAREEHPLYLISRRAIITVCFTLIALLFSEEVGLTFMYQTLFYRIVIGC